MQKIPRGIRRILAYLLILAVTSALLLFFYVINIGNTNTITVRHAYNSVSKNNTNVIDSNHTYSAEFKAKFSYLGIIELGLQSDGIVNNYLIFKMKEKGDSTWDYVGEYKTRDVLFLKKYPFGFPLIPDSKGRSYIIEISLKNKNNIDHLELARSETLDTKYIYSFRYFILHPHKLESFLSDKVSTILAYYSIINAIVFYSFPILLYTSYLLLPKKYQDTKVAAVFFEYILKHNSFLSVTAFILILFYCFILNNNNDILIFVITIIWIYNIIRNRFNENLSYITSLGLILLTAILTIFNLNIIAEKTVVWSYIFLTIASLQLLFKILFRTSKTYTID